jgi:RNA-directed DNA polymerase
MNASLEMSVEFSVKERPISYASHKDAALFGIFNKLLSEDYEKWISDKPIFESVLAYRPNCGTNIEASKLTFEEIRNRRKCVAIAADISSFFDNLPHAQLKAGLAEITGHDLLPGDLYYVFKNITKYSFVEIKDIENTLGVKVLNSPICNYKIFRSHLKPLITDRKHEKTGIPQGSSLSGLFANIAMIEFDLFMKDVCDEFDASYRRYSDDICIIAPSVELAKNCYSKLQQVADSYSLVIKNSKTQISVFNLNSHRQCWSFRHVKDTSGGPSRVRRSRSAFQYLGFTFDGNQTLIRSSSIQRYYRKMRRNIFRYIGICARNNIPQNEIHLRGQYRRWTHQNRARGPGRRGNFITYAYRAAEVHDSLAIRKQVRTHIGKFRATIGEAIAKYY